MILVLGRRLYRLMLFILIVLLILPVCQYYAIRALNPQYVQLHEPRGQAIKVSSDLVEEDEERGPVSRFLYNLHEFYQNGL